MGCVTNLVLWNLHVFSPGNTERWDNLFTKINLSRNMTILLVEYYVVSCVMPHALGLLFYWFKKSLQQLGIAVLNSWRDEKFCKYIDILVLKFVNYTVRYTSIFESLWFQEWEYISNALLKCNLWLIIYYWLYIYMYMVYCFGIFFNCIAVGWAKILVYLKRSQSTKVLGFF